MAVLVGYVGTQQRFNGPHKWAALTQYCKQVETLLSTEGFLLPSSLEPGQTVELLDGLIVARKGEAGDVKGAGRHAGEVPDYMLLFPDRQADEQTPLRVR